MVMAGGDVRWAGPRVAEPDRGLLELESRGQIAAIVFKVRPSAEDLGQRDEVVVVFKDLLAGGQELVGFFEPPQPDERSVVVEPATGEFVGAGAPGLLAREDRGVEVEG